jgi:hypothetical protein
MDAIYVGMILVFSVATWGLVRLCESLARERGEKRQ